MPVEPVSFFPSRRKLCLYAAILGGFIFLCATYIWVVSRSARIAARDTLQTWVRDADEEIMRFVEFKLKDLQMLLLWGRISHLLSLFSL